VREVPTSSSDMVFYFRGGGTNQGNVLFQSDGNGGKILIRRGNTVLATSTLTLDNTKGWWLEIEAVTQNSPDGLCQVYLDGVLWVSVSGVDFLRTGNPGFDQVQWFGDDHFVDDVVITSLAEGRLAEEYYGILQPITGNGTTTDMTPSAGTNWQNVAENLIDTTTYNQSVGAGDEDLYTTRLNAYVDSVYGVVVHAVLGRQGQADDAGNNVQLSVRSGSTTGSSDTINLSPGYSHNSEFFAENPDTASAWTESDLKDLSVGLKTTI